MLTAADLEERIETDGALEPAEMTTEFAQAIREQVWGQGFPEPRFAGRFAVETQRVVAEKHVKAMLVLGRQRFSAIRFGSAESLPAEIEAVYRLDVDDFNGATNVQLVLEYTR